MNESAQLIDLLSKKEKLVAMLAPSFPIVYKYPAIITMLKKLGFTYVVEISAGAKKTNEELVDDLKKDPASKYITSPCPSVVRIIRKQYPHLVKYLPSDVDSPMVATAKIVREKFPGFKPVFIGPCIVKKLEANEDYPELNILVLTFKETDEVFKHFGIKEETNETDKFDLKEEGMTRLYPTDGGLSHSSGITSAFSNKELQVVSGWKNCQEALNNFEKNKEVRLLDVLYCEGGCIGGPGIVSNLPIEERKRLVFEFWLEGLYQTK